MEIGRKATDQRNPCRKFLATPCSACKEYAMSRRRCNRFECVHCWGFLRKPVSLVAAHPLLVHCAGSTPSARQSSGWLWHKTRWLSLCSGFTEWQSSRLRATDDQTTQEHQRHVLSSPSVLSTGKQSLFYKITYRSATTDYNILNRPHCFPGLSKTDGYTDAWLLLIAHTSNGWVIPCCRKRHNFVCNFENITNCNHLLARNAFVKRNRCAIAMTFVRLSGTDVHCDHIVHFSTNLSLWLDSPVFWTQNMSIIHLFPAVFFQFHLRER